MMPLRIVVSASLILIVSACGSWPLPTPEPPPRVGPSAGALVIAGGGSLGPEIYRRFLELAGGPDAPIVVIPTASPDEQFPATWAGLEELRSAGATNVRLLHTRDRQQADDSSFTAGLAGVRGVWISGGRQWRLVDAYLGTRTQGALFDLLARGGVVGGSSAGASILASFLVRGAVDSNQTVMDPVYRVGFGLLRGVAVDQHLFARNRQDDLCGVVRRYPSLLGIGIDEGTAIVVRRDAFEVIGRSSVAIYSMEEDDGATPIRRLLLPGERYDMSRRRAFAPARVDGCPGTAGRSSLPEL